MIITDEYGTVSKMQPNIGYVVGKSSTGLSGWSKTGHVHLYWVEGNTVRSDMAGDAL